VRANEGGRDGVHSAHGDQRGRAVRIGAGLVLLVVGSLFGGAWWIMRTGALAIVTSTRGTVLVAAVAAEPDSPRCSTD